MSGYEATTRGDLLVQQILQNETESDPGALANELLDEFWRGYPIENLRPLLRHSEREVVEAGAFLAQELVGRIAPVIDDVRRLLDHESFDVRFDALGAVLDNVSDDGEAIAHAMMLMQDPHESVRWKALRFALLADDHQLAAAVPYLEPDVRVALEQSGLMCAIDEGWHKVKPGLQDPDDRVRRWSAVAAARCANAELLSEAARSEDREVAAFAAAELRSLRKFGPARNRAR
jgi:hypothetical protein